MRRASEQESPVTEQVDEPAEGEDAQQPEDVRAESEDGEHQDGELQEGDLQEGELQEGDGAEHAGGAQQAGEDGTQAGGGDASRRGDAGADTPSGPGRAKPKKVPGEAENAAAEAAKLAAVTKKTGSRASKLSTTPSAKSEVTAVEAAEKGPPNEALAGGKAAQLDDMDQAPAAEFDKEGFIAAVEAKINAQAPRTLEQAKGFEKSGALQSVKEGVKSTAGAKKDASTGATKTATDAAPNAARGSTTVGGELQPPPAPAKPKSVNAASAMPLPKPAAATDLSEPQRETDAAMAEADISEEQLASSNEPAFVGALADKKAGEAHSTTAPGPVRAAEQQTLAASKAAVVGKERQTLAGMLADRKGANRSTAAQKSGAKGSNEGKRTEHASRIESIYTATQSATKAILDGIDAQVDIAFETGEAAARKAFENSYKTELDAYYDDRYSGVIGKGRWLKDKVFSPPSKVQRIIEAARRLYVAEMRKVVRKIAEIVSRDLKKAKERVAAGRLEISNYVANLPKALQKEAAQLAKDVQGKFDALDNDVSSKRDALVDHVADRYKAAKEEVDARVEEMRAENMGLWDKAKAAIVGVIQTIIALKNALMSALRKAANAITTIIKDPIGFLSNLISAFTQGLQLYLSNLKSHLLKGVIKWLTGAFGDMQITIPAKFDLKGIVHLVLQVLGVTWGSIRAQIVQRLGPAGAKVIGRVEQGVGLITKLLTQGPIALWEMIVQRISGLYDMVLGKIQDYIQETIIGQGIRWLMALINPAAAFVKACEMIVDGVMWLWNNAARIIELVDTIAGSALAIAKGSVGTAAKAVEGVLARLTPILISFLASMLKLDGIVGKVKDIIRAVRKPISKVISKVVGKGVAFGRRLLKSPLGKKVSGGYKKAKAWAKGKVDAAKKWGKKKVQAVKQRIYGGDDTPDGKEKREKAATTSAVAHLDKWRGKRIGAAIALPGLMAIKLRRGLQVLDLIPSGKYWGVRASVDRSIEKTSQTEHGKAESDQTEPNDHPAPIDEAEIAALKSAATQAHGFAAQRAVAENAKPGQSKKTVAISTVPYYHESLSGWGSDDQESNDYDPVRSTIVNSLVSEQHNRMGITSAVVAEHPEVLPTDEEIDVAFAAMESGQAPPVFERSSVPNIKPALDRAWKAAWKRSKRAGSKLTSRAGASDHGVLGRYGNSHAERQVRAATGATAIGVSKEVCGRCRATFDDDSKRSGQVIVIRDPTGSLVFRPGQRPNYE